ncbi:hypothetical protein HGA34_00010 [Candidatus Falkowbacteria bacterium]|nr:hypothetical protein [Candidatus Falkowbacteria bacterium]
MKKSLACFLLAACLLSWAHAVWAKQAVEIGPYGNRETAIEGNVLVQLEAVKETLGQVKVGMFERLDIKIVGSANQTGSKAENGQYSKDRAHAVEGYLKSAFPEAQFAVIPFGSELNVRAVQVSWQVRSIISAKQISMAVILSVILAIAMFMKTKRPQTKVIEVIEKRFGAPVAVQYEGDWYHFIPTLNAEGKSEVLHTEMKDGKAVTSAFKNDPKSLAKSVARSLRDNPGLIDGLVRENRWKLIGPINQTDHTGVKP